MSSQSELSAAALSSSLKQLGSSETDELREWLRQSGKESLYFLTKAILSRSKLTAPLHKEMCQFVQETGTPKGLMLVPRGHYKTTICSEGYPIWRLVNNPNDTVLIANAVFTNAQKFLRVIKHHFEANELFRWVYSDIVPDFTKVKWTETELVVKRTVDVKESSIEAIGSGGTAVGRHFSCIVKDDLVNEDHLISSEQMSKVIDWHKYSASLLIHPRRDRELVVGTRWAFTDLYSHIQENEPSFKVYERAAVDETGEPIFPEEFDHETLRDLEARQGPYIYSCQYMNKPVDPARTLIKLEWLNYIDDIHAESLTETYKRCNIFIIVDPALSQKRHGDFTGLVVCYVDHNYDVYVEEADRHRVGAEDLIKLVFQMVERYNPTAVGIELVSLAKALRVVFDQAMRERKKWFYIQELQPSTRETKEMRVRASLQPLFAQRKVFIRKSQLALKDELLKFPFGAHDDIIDALAYLPHMWIAGRAPIIQLNDPMSDPFNIEYILHKLQGKEADARNPLVLHRRRN